MKKILSWLDTHLLRIMAGFLLVFIPLYPKWPLFDVLYGYNVRVRLEDFFVAATILLFLIQFLRKKINIWVTPVSRWLVVYLVIGLLSVVCAVLITGTVPMLPMHVGKSLLHWLRRAEYFSLFFILFVSIRSWRTVKIYLGLFFVTLLAVIIYSYGQKYLYWPAFSTMNREFAKGWWLYLTEHARVLSTFGGHYDLAAYLVIALTLAWSFFFGAVNKFAKIIFGLLLAGGFWTLILTASRSSFIGYILGLTIVVFLWTFKRGLGWGLTRWVVTVSLSILLMLSFGDLSDRFLRLIRIADRVSVLKAVLLKPAGTPPQNQAMFLENNLAAVALKSDVPPSIIRPGDVAEDQNLWPTTEKTASGASIIVNKPRGYSQNALIFDLSMGIRFDATWPMAIKGFLTNPLLGSGYATLNKTSSDEFTDAESTDNDFLRSLGETGLLGFLGFFGTLGLMIVITFKSLGGIKDPVLYSLATGFIGLILGLLANAFLVDIFEASKVAYVFWGVCGLTMGSLYLNREKIKADWQPLKIYFPWREVKEKVFHFVRTDIFWIGLVIILLVVLRLYKFSGPIADWHSWRQADTSAVTRDFVKKQAINWLYPTYDDLSNTASGLDNLAGLRMVEFPIYNAVAATVKAIVPEISVEEAGRLTTIFSQVTSLIFLFLITRKFLSRRIAYLTAIIYTIIPYNIFYGRSVLPDPSMVAAALGAVWFGAKYTATPQKRFLILSLILAAVSLLIKPFAIFLLMPLGYFWLVGFKSDKKKLITSLFYCFIAVLPLVLWRIWIARFPEGVPASDWLFNGNGIRFKGAFWYWLFADRIGRLILGYWGLVLVGVGLVRPVGGKFKWFPFCFLLSAFCYLVVFATGNVQHDYYQILLMPSLAILGGLGLDCLLTLNWRGKALAIVSTIFMVMFGWYFIRDFYNINHPEIVEAGKVFSEMTGEHEKALVIAPYDGDSAFLYQTKRKGWPIMEKSVEDLIKMGADYYVSVRFDDTTNKVLAKAETEEFRLLNPKLPRKPYTLLAQTEQYVIVQLVPTKDLPGN